MFYVKAGVLGAIVSNSLASFYIGSPQALSGDFDGNGSVEFDVFFQFSDHFGTRIGGSGYDGQFDLDADGEVGFGDFFLFADNFGKTSAGK